MTDSALIEAKRILVASLRDPAKVVLDANHAFEEADGTWSVDTGAPRACLVALKNRAARTAGADPDALRAAVQDAVGRWSLIKALRDLGPSVCADRIEAT